MDFELDETQQVIAARRLESALASMSRDADGAAAWQALAKAGLLALTLPGWLGGDDLGALEAAVLLTEVGRRAAHGPRAGDDHARRAAGRPLGRAASCKTSCWPGSAEGETILTAARARAVDRAAGQPATVATPDAPRRDGHGHEGRRARTRRRPAGSWCPHRWSRAVAAGRSSCRRRGDAGVTAAPDARVRRRRLSTRSPGRRPASPACSGLTAGARSDRRS